MSRLPTKSTGRVDLCTPPSFLERVYLAIGFPELDPASNPGSAVKAEVSCVDPARREEWGELPEGFYYEDGLALDWDARGVFFNPPYKRGLNGLWAAKAEREAERGTPIIGLVTVATSEVWWQPYWNADRLLFLLGRVKHIGEKDPAPFAQCVVGWNVRASVFEMAFGELGRLRV